MTDVGKLLGIHPEAVPAWHSLSAALDDLGRGPVCGNDPDSWSADGSLKTRREAAEACGWCPVLKECAAFAELSDERQGVWGGVDRGQRPTPTRERKAA
jgi:hypothetical protein